MWWTDVALIFSSCLPFITDISGLFVIWRRRVFVHFPRSLQGCYALSLQWPLVKACGYYVPLCKHTIPCPGFIIYLFFLSMFSLGFSYWKLGFLIFACLCRYVEVNMDSAAIVWPLFNSLQAFWPGLQVCSLFLFSLPWNM